MRIELIYQTLNKACALVLRNMYYSQEYTEQEGVVTVGAGLQEFFMYPGTFLVKIL